MTAPEDFFPLHLIVAEFDIDRGPTIRAQLPSPVPVVSSHLSPPPLSAFAAPAKKKQAPLQPNWKSDDDEACAPDPSGAASLPSADLENADGDDYGGNEPHSAAYESPSDPRPETWSQYLADQMMPDGSDRNERNTSYLMLNRGSAVEHDSGVLCCVFQMSSVAKWQPRAAILSVQDDALCVVDIFDCVRSAASFAIPRSNIEPQVYLRLGPAASCAMQELGALPAEKLAQVSELFLVPPLRQKVVDGGAGPSLIDTLQQGVADLDAGSGGSSSSSGPMLRHGPKAFAHIRGEACSAGIAFSSAADLERVRGWIAAAKGVAASSESGLGAAAALRSNPVARRCLYGAVVTVTKKMPHCKRGSVNMSVAVCSAQLRWLHCLQHFLESVALACCDATALIAPELVAAQIAAIADSAYAFVVSHVLPIAAGTSPACADITQEAALAAVARRLILRDDSAWIGLQCVTPPWVVPQLNLQQQQQQQEPQPDGAAAAEAAAASSEASTKSSGIAVAMLPTSCLPPPPLQPILAATGTSSHASLSGEHAGAAHICSIVGILSEAGFARLLVHILLQRRVIVISRGGGGSRAAQMVMALGSLFAYFDEHFLSRRVVPYASVSVLDVLVSAEGVLAGTVNPLFETKFGKTSGRGGGGGIDVIADLDQRMLAVAASVGGDGKRDANSAANSRDNAGSAAEFCGSEMLARWADEFARSLRALLLRTAAAAMSSGGAMLQRNEESSILEDTVRLMVVREISILLWRMARNASFHLAHGTAAALAAAAKSGVLAQDCIPKRLAESRVFTSGRWLGRGLDEAAVFGEHCTRLLLPLDDRSFLDESMIVSFLQHGVRLAAAWAPADMLRAVVAAPRALQCLSVLCCHSSSVVRLLASLLLDRMKRAHPALDSVAASQVNMFLHFAADACNAEFRAQAAALK